MGNRRSSISKEQGIEIILLIENKVRPKAIAEKLVLPLSSVYWFLKQNKISIPKAGQQNRPEKSNEIEAIDYSILPDNYIFRHINYAIP